MLTYSLRPSGDAATSPYFLKNGASTWWECLTSYDGDATFLSFNGPEGAEVRCGLSDLPAEVTSIVATRVATNWKTQFNYYPAGALDCFIYLGGSYVRSGTRRPSVGYGYENFSFDAGVWTEANLNNAEVGLTAREAEEAQGDVYVTYAGLEVDVEVAAAAGAIIKGQFGGLVGMLVGALAGIGPEHMPKLIRAVNAAYNSRYRCSGEAFAPSRWRDALRDLREYRAPRYVFLGPAWQH